MDCIRLNSWVAFPSPGDLPNPEMEPRSPALQADSLPTDPSLQFSSVQFSRSVVSDSLWPHELQHSRPPCPSPTPGVHPNPRPSSWWCHSAISSSVVPFSSCPQSLPASESFPMSQLFSWGGQSTEVSALASFLPKNTQDWSPLEWTGWISLQSMGLSRIFSNTTVQKHQFLSNSYFKFLLPPPYMVLQETVKRIIWREARRVFLGTPHQATGKPRVTGLPAWLRIVLHSDFSPGAPLAQSTNPLFSFALESYVKVTVHCSFIKNIFQYYREYILLPPYWKSQADTEMDKTDVLEETRKILKVHCLLTKEVCWTAWVLSFCLRIDR